MGTQVTVILPDDLYHRAERLAQLTSREVAEVLADTIALSLTSLSSQPASVTPVTELTDEEVLSQAEIQMAPGQDQRLSTLLHRQQAGELSDMERSEMLALMQVYLDGLLRKAQALREAVRRGLREPLEPCAAAMCQISSGGEYGSGPRTDVDIAKVRSSTCLGCWSLTTSSPSRKAAPMPRTTCGSLAGCAMGSRASKRVHGTR